ncbi:DUF7473 family protein [Halomarina oriensis]|uniref:Yip1 domain-containing protein n=1 Tax=Halomarina oriensis TaxID=671145 RepID=A0A6B0GIK0_9EURY|nr:hypothetical protein [Halomarina oriensis]MWG34706.1 hypothetical protein [Halomarina oriensis]
MIPAQVDVTGGGMLAIVVTFLLAWLFYSVALHLAATFFLGDVPTQRAATAALAPAVFSMLLQLGQIGGADIPIAVFIVLSFVAALFAIHLVYRLRWTTATALTLLYFAFAFALGLALYNIITFL